ncbi:MAG: hypothetical protein RLZZ399_2061 [Verrucomicrobiota bacterium]
MNSPPSRPTANRGRRLSNSDGGVRFESTNYPGMFLTVNESGLVILAGNRPEEQSTFVLAR